MNFGGTRKQVKISVRALILLTTVISSGCTGLVSQKSSTATDPTSVSTPVSPSAPSITVTSLANGQVGTPYSQPLTTIGGAPPYTWSIALGTLPVGVALNSSTGLIGGVPTAPVNAVMLTFKVADSSSPAQTSNISLPLTIVPAGLVISTTSLPTGTVGTPYSQTVNATGGTPPYTWTLTLGALPAGIALDSATGRINGTPASAANAIALSFTVTDSTTPVALMDTVVFSLAVAAGAGHSISLNWDASVSSATTGYNIYRSNFSGSGYDMVNSTPVSGLAYTDATVVGGLTYYYVSTAVDPSGDESAFSNEIQLSVP